MSFIKDRLRRAEAASRKEASGRCARCGLLPQERGYIVVDHKDPVPELPEVCPECGRNTRVHIVVVYENEEACEGEGVRPIEQMHGYKA